MLTRHPSRLLAQYCDGQLPAERRRRVEAHLATCERCRRERDDILFAALLMRQIAVVSPPPTVWHAINEQLQTMPSSDRRYWRWQIAVAALALAITAGLLYTRTDQPVVRRWEVALRDSGRPEQSSFKAEGDWIETTAASRARIVVGPIGTVDVEPQTRVRLGALRSDAYRLALAHGTIRARISAPPRLFIVDTPASTLVDLGCAYRVTVDLDGRGSLQVTEGWTSLEWRGREALVPAGASVRIRPGDGPGMPTFDDASSALNVAVAAFDSGDDAEVVTILSQARVRDTLTLWHLLSRVTPGERSRVYDRIAELVPLPESITRDRVLQLNAAMLTQLKEELSWKW